MSTLRAKLTEEWDVRGIDVATLVADHKGTIRGIRDPAVSSERKKVGRAPSAGISALPQLVTDPASDTRQLVIGDTIGEGGMGIVWGGRQMSLRREVAVKSVHPKAPAAAAFALLREARVTGALEHPNIVPIHALGKDESGRPLIVMKRIEGASWEQVLSRQMAQGPGMVMSRLDYHIDVLVNVAKAVNFAHSRGIIHRDIKPDNVMIGAFGEVYLVDWGIAVTTAPDNELDLPYARDVAEVSGSPAYMAPEMATADGAAIGPTTDVYLLGATLHQVLTGAPPHEAPTTVAMLVKAYASTPCTYDATIPAGLADICHTAMHRDPAMRYQTAASFAAALGRFIEHRDSTLLADEASAKLEALREQIAVADGDDRQRLYDLFNEARFGFSHALRIWESNTAAREQLQTAVELMIGYELDHGSAGAAAALLGALPIRQPKLADRIDQKREQERADADQLDELKHQQDATGADRPRAWLALSVSITWPSTHAVLWWVDHTTSYSIGHYQLAALYGLYLFASVATGFARRETFFARALFGIQTHLTHMMCFGGLAALWLLSGVLGIDATIGWVMTFFFGAIFWIMNALTVDKRMLSYAVPNACALGALALWRDQGLVIMAANGTVAAIAMGLLRLRTRRAEDTLPLSEQWSRTKVEAMTRRGLPPTERAPVPPTER